MPLQVLGAGFGRTSTLSLKLALEQLGFGPCHHMMEVFGKPDEIALWQDAADGKSVDWERVFTGYQSAVDWPTCAFWQPLSELYPEAKIILSLRDSEDWYRSVSNTIFRGMMSDEVVSDPHGVMVRTLIKQNTFGGDLATKAHVIKVFEEHNALVQATIPPERLLVYRPGDGWEPLCQFLEVDVPSEPYPNTNSTEEFQARFQANAKK